MRITLPTQTDPAVTLLPSGVQLKAHTLEQDFLHAPDATNVTVLVRNLPYTSYALAAPYHLDGEMVRIVAQFKSSALEGLFISMESDSKSWRDWSEADELNRKQRLDLILERTYGQPPYHHAWGEVRSGYDPRGGNSAISIRFF